MKRFSGLNRAISRATQPAALTASPTHDRILHTAPYTTTTTTSSSPFKSRFLWDHAIANHSSGHWTRSAAANAVAGTMMFSVAASTLAEEVHAKEAPSKKFNPKEVVLYQYEACPFCNKVKGILFF